MLCNRPTALHWFNGKTCHRLERGISGCKQREEGGAVVSVACVYFCQELINWGGSWQQHSQHTHITDGTTYGADIVSLAVCGICYSQCEDGVSVWLFSLLNNAPTIFPPNWSITFTSVKCQKMMTNAYDLCWIFYSVKMNLSVLSHEQTMS